MTSGPPRRLVAAYRWTTRLMPASYRDKYADEQVHLFERVWLDERPAGRVAAAAWTGALFARAFLAAIGARRDHRRRPHRRTVGRGGRGMSSDLRITIRALKASGWYAFTVAGVVAVTTALAITTFAIVDGVLFRPLPYQQANRLVSVQPGFRDIPPGRLPSGASAGHVDLAHWRAAVPEVEFTGLSAGRTAETGSGVGINEDTAGIAEVLPNFFDVLGMRPLFGGFTADDFQTPPARYRPVILMYDTWQGRFGGDPDVVGTVEILIRQRDFGFRIVGVMPRGFTFPSSRVSIDFIAPMVPLTPASVSDPRIRSVGEVVARLPHDMSPSQLTERLAPGLAASAASYSSLGARRGYDPKTERPYDMVRVLPLSESLGLRSGGLFKGVAAAAALLVLLAAVNMSSLLTSRAIERRRELGVRRALGATRLAIVRLWIAEAGVLLVSGTIVGVLAATVLLPIIVSLLPESVVLLKTPRLDWRVAGFVAAMTAVLCAIVSIAPVRSSLRPVAGGPAKGGSSERVRTTARFAVVAGQIAAAFVLTTVGACLVGSLLTVYGQDLPIRTDGVFVLETRLHGPGGSRSEVAERVARGRVLRERLAAIPGVTSVGLVQAEVLRGDGGADLFSRPDGAGRLPGLATWGVTGGFYQVVEPVVTAGRLPTTEELEAGDPVLVVSERVAGAYWPGASALGQTLIDIRGKVPHTVIGVVRDVRWHGWDLESPMIYGPYARLTSSIFQTFFIRTELDTAATIRQAVRMVEDTDPAMRTRLAAPLEDMYSASIALRRFQSWLFGGYAVASLAVVGAGILGLLAMSAARRTKEIGIRCALGATPRSVTRLMVREQVVAVGTGLLLGGAVAAWAVRLVEGYLYELSAADPRIWAAAVATILLTAGAGTLMPALRASRVDPVAALRTE